VQTYKYRVKTNKADKKAGKRDNKYLSVFVITGLLLLFLWTVAGPYGFWKLHRLEQKRKDLYASLITAEKQNTELQNKIKTFSEDKHLQEHEVRMKLGWIKKNEILYKFVK